MRRVKTYERQEPEIEKHEGAGTGLDLTAEEVLAEALALVEPPEPAEPGAYEPYEELHRGRGTGLDLDADGVMAEVEEILGIEEIVETVDEYLESYWAGTAETTERAEEAAKG